MNDFKNGKTLLQEYREKGKLRRWERPIPEAGESKLRQIYMKPPTEYTGEVCEQWIPGGCSAMIEAVSLGLTKMTFICTGTITTTCAIQTRLAAGMTVGELFKK